MNRSGAISFGDPDLGRKAALEDGIGHMRLVLRVSPLGMQQDATWFRGRIRRLSARLKEEGGAPGVVVESDDINALREEMLRLEREIGAAMGRKPVALQELDEPFGDEPMAAE